MVFIIYKLFIIQIIKHFIFYYYLLIEIPSYKGNLDNFNGLKGF